MSSVDILVPDLPESVSDATVVTWHKKVGDSVHRDEVLVDIETDKVVLEVPSPESGILEDLLEKEGMTVTARQILGRLRSNHTITGSKDPVILKEKKFQIQKEESIPVHNNNNTENLKKESQEVLSPSSRRLITEYDLHPSDIKGSGVGGRITKSDIIQYLIQNKEKSSDLDEKNSMIENRREKRIPMTRLRKCIAERLLEAKNNTAMLTTFNEVNMKPIMNLRQQYGEIFKKRHGIRLGLMSFYIKAVLEALKRFPEVNASIDGEEIVYRNYFDVSIAISTPRGLVTPVIRNIDTLSMSEIEKRIKELAIKGNDGKLKIEELTGGNFTITNGGVFGSLMSTPLINPPQSAILGMHAIKDRVMAFNGDIVILPMMYLALSYDHRLIDGKESVNFLITIKEILEDPNRLLLNI